MANSLKFNDITLTVGDTLSVTYRLKEGDKERQQVFKGVLIKINGSNVENRMITIRKISKIGIGVERIIPLMSPNIVKIKIDKEGRSTKSKLYFARNLTESQLKQKLYTK